MRTDFDKGSIIRPFDNVCPCCFNRNKSNTTFLKGESRGKDKIFLRDFLYELRGQTLQRGLKYTPIAMFVLSFF